MQPSQPGAHLPKPIALPPPHPPSASSLPSAPPPPSHKGSFLPPPSYDQLLHQTQETPQEKLARMKSLYPSESYSSTTNGVQPPLPSFTAAAAGGVVARPISLQPPVGTAKVPSVFACTVLMVCNHLCHHSQQRQLAELLLDPDLCNHQIKCDTKKKGQCERNDCPFKICMISILMNIKCTNKVKRFKYLV